MQNITDIFKIGNMILIEFQDGLFTRTILFESLDNNFGGFNKAKELIKKEFPEAIGFVNCTR